MMERTYPVAHHQTGLDQRVESPIRQVTGKGLNVSRALQALGGKTIGILPCHDFAWGFVAPIVKQEAFEVIKIPGPPGFRAGFALINPEGQSTCYLENGLSWDERTTSDFMDHVRGTIHKRNPSLVVLAGSTPPNAPGDLYAQISKDCQKTGTPVVLDAIGSSLLTALDVGVLGVKINLEEFSETFGITFENNASFSVHLNDLRKKYNLDFFGVTAGEGSAFFSFPLNTYRAVPPKVRVRNPVGCGDSLLAGLLYAQSLNFDETAAIQFAMATGTANAENLSVATFNKERVEELKGKCSVSATPND
jgi:fructose-1-phosphate kinase PfkB-like protein